jgi:hypothetical protein
MVPLAVALSGCGSSQAVWVHGKLTKGGVQYPLPADQRLNLTFYAVDEFKDGAQTIPAGQSYPANYKPDDGTFTVPGTDGRGIPPGKYRLSLVQRLTRQAVDKKNEKVKRNQKLFDRDTDFLNGQFGEHSPIVVEIKDSTELAIELDKYKDEIAQQAKMQAAGSVSD